MDGSKLLLGAWSDAGRELEAQGFLTRLQPRLARRFGATGAFLRRVDLSTGWVRTSAAAGSATQGKSSMQLDQEKLERFVAWAAGREPRMLSPGGGKPTWESTAEPRANERDLFLALVPHGLGPPLWLVPLCEHDGPLGLLGVCLGEEDRPDPGALADLALLTEPCAAALANDGRLHELVRGREAAEADKRALLSRLQRQDIAPSILGSESGLREVLERVRQVAATDAPVLLLGETGSGKEVIARAIHERSPRRKGPVVRVNCGAIPAELVDSELFGHEKGSFTGASATHRGWFERADGGTLFLDEIGELSPGVQVRLLRVLQDGSFERVGGQSPITVDVRMIAATHRDLEAMVSAGRFRQDLWYRISVFPIHLPALRERPEDIPELAAHFAWQAGKRLGGAPLVPGPGDLELLLAYDWPGNVRELAAVIERAAILGEGRRLEVAGALGVSPARRAAAPLVAPAPRVAPTQEFESARPSGESTLEQVVRAHLEDALERTRGRIEGPHGAAALLGINPHTLRSRMRKLGIEWARFRAPRRG